MKRMNILFFLLLFSVSAMAQVGKVFTLRQCLDVALENNLTMKQNRVAVAGNNVQLQQASMGRLPSLNANGSQSINFGRSVNPYDNTVVADQRVNSNNLGLSASVNVFSGFQVRNTVEQRRLTLKASEEDVNTTKNNVVLGVVDAFANVLSNKALLSSAKLQLEATKAQLEKTRILVESGRLPQTSYLDLMAQSATEETNVVLAENNLDLARLALSQWMQIDVAQIEDISEPGIIINESEEVPAARIYQIAESNQPQIKAAQLRVYSAEKGIAVAKGGFYPNITFQAGIFTNYSSLAQRFVPGKVLDTPLLIPIDNFQVTTEDGTVIPITINQIQRSAPGTVKDLSFSEQFDNNLRKGISFNVTIPIFNGFQSRYSVETARINKLSAQIQLDQQKNNLRQTIESAAANEKAAKNRLRAVENQIKALEESYRSAEQRFTLGTMSSFDFIQSKNNLIRAQNDRTRFKYDYFIRRALLDFYLGKELTFN